MDVKKLCDICSVHVAVDTCKLCGKRVCEKHYDSKLKICTDCKTGRK